MQRKFPERDWTLDAISALAKYRDNDLNGALEAFRIAAEKEPDWVSSITIMESHCLTMDKQKWRPAISEPPLTMSLNSKSLNSI